LLNGEPKRILTDELFSLVVEIASGKITKAEKIKFKEVVIFKRGVTV
jgi:altronate dehydratase